MDLLDRLLRHDAWTTGLLLDRCAELRDDELDRELGMGWGSVRGTLAHIIRNMEAWSGLMDGSITRRNQLPAVKRMTLEEMRTMLDRASDRLARVSRGVAARDGWDELWTDSLDDPPTRKTYGGAIAHVITHSMHHRAQVLHMLRRLGLKDLPEGDVLSWEIAMGGQP